LGLEGHLAIPKGYLAAELLAELGLHKRTAVRLPR
jgi:hypothetical protein